LDLEDVVVDINLVTPHINDMKANVPIILGNACLFAPLV